MGQVAAALATTYPNLLGQWLPTPSYNSLALQGLHMHIGSGVDYTHLQEVCGAMVDLVRTVKAQGMDLHAVSTGGGLAKLSGKTRWILLALLLVLALLGMTLLALRAPRAEALLAEGGMPDDPAAYVKRVNALLV